jgi:hypothetical protein
MGQVIKANAAARFGTCSRRLVRPPPTRIRRSSFDLKLIPVLAMRSLRHALLAEPDQPSSKALRATKGAIPRQK